MARSLQAQHALINANTILDSHTPRGAHTFMTASVAQVPRNVASIHTDATMVTTALTRPRAPTATQAAQSANTRAHRLNASTKLSCTCTVIHHCPNSAAAEAQRTALMTA